MVFRRARRGLRIVATHESTAHESARSQRFNGHEQTAAASRRDAGRRMLRLLRDPGAEGSITKGKRRLNWVWYWNYREADEQVTLLYWPHGSQTPHIRSSGNDLSRTPQKQMAIARALLPKQLRALLESTEKPFAQPVRELAVPQMVFGRVVLVGEAAFVLHPHTTAAAKVAADGMALGEALRNGDDNVEGKLSRFETSQLQMRLHLRHYGVRAGNQSQFPHG